MCVSVLGLTGRYNCIGTRRPELGWASAAAMSTAKRKAEDISVTTDDAGVSQAYASSLPSQPDCAPQPTLPATCLASVLNFLPYSDVRTSLLAGKTIAVDAAKHVDTLNIFKSGNLVAPAARCFTSVSEVNIFSLVTETDPYATGEQILCPRTCMVSVPFLTIFPELKRAFVGGHDEVLDPRHTARTCYCVSRCRTPSDHASLFRGLVAAFCGAFQTKLLPKNLKLSGIVKGQYHLRCDPRVEGDAGPSCGLCRSICFNFPLGIVRDLEGPHELSRWQGRICVSNVDRIGIMRQRSGGIQVLRSYKAAYHLFDLLLHNLRTKGVVADSDKGGEFVVRMKELNANNPLEVNYMPSNDFLAAKTMVGLGLDPRALPKDEVANWIRDIRKGEIWEKETYDCFVTLGFAMDDTELILVEPENEPGIDRYWYRR